MTRIAIVSDVHADVHALRDALAQIGRLGCDVVVCAGDVVDYGLFAAETIALLAEREIPTVRGNHDRWAVGDEGLDLPADARAWLAGLRKSLYSTKEGVRVAVHHATPVGDMDGVEPESIEPHEARRLLKRADADVLVVGHTHRACRIEVSGSGIIVNPAALLRDPADGAGNPPATGTFGVLELPSLAFTVHRARDGAEVHVPTFKLGWFSRTQ